MTVRASGAGRGRRLVAVVGVALISGCTGSGAAHPETTAAQAQPAAVAGSPSPVAPASATAPGGRTSWPPTSPTSSPTTSPTTSLTSSARRSTPPKPTATPKSPAAAAKRSSCPTFPADNYWHANISRLPVNPHSAQWLAHMSTDRNLHPDFGPAGSGQPGYGIPVTVVSAAHPLVAVHFDYAAESDRRGYPLGADTRIEGGATSSGDRHAVIVDTGTCRLYETYGTRNSDGHWSAGSGATWSLRSNALRPNGWTSADAAGLPILPGLLRWTEVEHLHVDHAIRFTTNITAQRHVWPARHDAGSQTGANYPPMGARFRLRSSYHPKGFDAEAMAVVRAMQTYGLVLADNGSPWFFQGEQNSHWPAKLIEELKRIPAAQFEAVDTSGLEVSANSAATR